MSSQGVVDFRKRIKIALVKAFGGECQICKKHFPEYVFDFHHIKPEEKSFGLGNQSTTRSRAACAEEAKKCVLLCANCHRMVEYGEFHQELYCNFNEAVYYNSLEEMAQKNSEIKKSKQQSKKPSREELKAKIRTTSFLQIGRQYGVADNTIRKWCISYNLPSRVKDIKLISDADWVDI